MGNENRKNTIGERLINFAIRIVALVNKLPKTPAGYAIANQLIRSGTSIGANSEEAKDAVSNKDFLNKISISLKEARETFYWLRIIKSSKLLNEIVVNSELDECNEIISILVKSVKTIKNKL